MIGWKRPKGRDNKTRESKKGKPPLVSIGYKKEKGQVLSVVYNFKELMQAEKGGMVILGKVGAKKKKEMVKKAQELGITFQNLNVKRMLRGKNRPSVVDLKETRPSDAELKEKKKIKWI